MVLRDGLRFLTCTRTMPLHHEWSLTDGPAKQLQLETLSASRPNQNPSKTRIRRPSKRALEAEIPARPTTANPPTPSRKRVKPLPQLEFIPTGPFLSFFAKPHQRAAALDKSRRTGRTRWAFGHPVPEVVEEDFWLPEEMVSPAARKASARLRRGMKRGRE